MQLYVGMSSPEESVQSVSTPRPDVLPADLLVGGVSRLRIREEDGWTGAAQRRGLYVQVASLAIYSSSYSVWVCVCFPIEGVTTVG